ncbi:unnamed protein product [Fraxinus pennsylvanica]|uniref:Uncharacterized protein n=1 Tax=Fraxinus pennsylvanica TaxID=56036 RepID=A0AAD2E620_9LAMI|nr:unnamed protein product [Fraxinus pennsylvanica]
MKGLSKPISSPSRAEKFPPPLMRFLRSNTGSRSRGRSRSIPMFRMRSKKDAAPVIEPSSPKVTCFGQVQVRTSSSKTTSSQRPGDGSSAAANRPCWGLKKTLFFHKIISSKCHRPRHSCGGGLCFGSGFCKKVDTREDSCRVDSNQEIQRNEVQKKMPEVQCILYYSQGVNLNRQELEKGLIQILISRGKEDKCLPPSVIMMEYG